MLRFYHVDALRAFFQNVSDFVESFVALSTLNAALSIFSAIATLWIMQIITASAGTRTTFRWLRLLQRLALCILALAFVLSAITPLVTTSPPWCADVMTKLAVLFLLMVAAAMHRYRQKTGTELED